MTLKAHNDVEPGCEYTTPENRGVCGFCGGEEGGYAKRGPDGKFHAACWPCVKPEGTGAAQTKRKPVGTVYTEDLDLDTPDKTKAPGIKAGGHRPKVL